MKKLAKRVVGLTCAIILAVSSFGMETFALTIGDTSWVTSVKVEWQNPTEIVRTETQEKQFIMSTKTAQGRVNNLYFSFPTEGGVRFHADDTGFWNPKESSTITYTSEGAAIVMQANDTKVKVYTTASPWNWAWQSEHRIFLPHKNRSKPPRGAEENRRRSPVFHAIPDGHAALQRQRMHPYRCGLFSA